MIANRLLSCLMALLLLGCSRSTNTCTLPEEIEEIAMDIQITRLEKVFFEQVTSDGILTGLERYPAFAEKYLLEGEFEDRSAFVEEIVTLHNDPGMQELYREVLIHYPGLEDLENMFEDAFKSIKYFFPEFEPPIIYTYVSGFTNDIYLTKDMLVISLDYFLPNDHRFQPVELPQYIGRRYTKEHLVPTVITAISSWFNKTDLKDNTLLAEMIFYGKSYHFTKQVMPCTPDEFIIGYTSEDIIACYSNEEMIYAHFIENELFYETNPFEIRKYTGEAPFTDEISLDAPGRIGRWMGWNIVDDYRENNAIGLPELMKQDNAREIFRLSGYRPR